VKFFTPTHHEHSLHTSIADSML